MVVQDLQSEEMWERRQTALLFLPLSVTLHITHMDPDRLKNPSTVPLGAIWAHYCHFTTHFGVFLCLTSTCCPDVHPLSFKDALCHVSVTTCPPYVYTTCSQPKEIHVVHPSFWGLLPMCVRAPLFMMKGLTALIFPLYLKGTSPGPSGIQKAMDAQVSHMEGTHTHSPDYSIP